MRLVVAAPDEVDWALDHCFTSNAEIDDALRDFEQRAEVRRRNQADTTDTSTVEVDENAPVVQVVNLILEQAVRDRASDVHIEPQQDSRARPRPHRRRAARGADAPGVDGLAARQPHQGHGRHEHRRAAPPAGRPDRGRRSTTASSTSASRRPSTVFGEKCVLRLLDKRRALFKLAELGMPHDTLDAYREAHPLALRHGHVRGPDRFRQDDDALRDARRDQRRRDQRHDDRGPGRVRLPDDQPDPDQRAGRRHVRQPGCGRSCARTPTRSSSARSATSRPPASRCRPRSPVTSCMSSLHATDATSRAAPLPRHGHRAVPASRRRCSASSASGSCAASARTAWSRTRRPPRSWRSTSEAAVRPGDEVTQFVRGAGCNFCADTGYFDRIGVYEVLHGHRRDPRADRQRARSHSDIRVDRAAARACGRCATRPSASSPRATTTIAEVLRTVYVL